MLSVRWRRVHPYAAQDGILATQSKQLWNSNSANVLRLPIWPPSAHSWLGCVVKFIGWMVKPLVHRWHQPINLTTQPTRPGTHLWQRYYIFYIYPLCLWCVMASDIWGFSTTFLVYACFLIVCGLTAKSEEGIDNGTIICTSPLLVEIVRWKNVLRMLISGFGV